MKNKKQRRVMFLLILILGVTIGFALLSTTLYINGTAGIKKNTYDIHWDSTSVVVNPNSVGNTTPSVIGTNDNTVEFETTLELPGEFYEFTVDAINEGTIDGEITLSEKEVFESDGITETTLPNYIHYTVTYDDGTTLPTIGDVLKSGESQTYKIRVEYDSEATTLPNADTTYKLKYRVTYSQHKETGPDYTVGDLFSFNPVTLEECTPGTTNCYQWYIINKTSDSYELYYYNYPSDIAWSQQNPATVIGNYSSGWNNKLMVDSKYDVTVNENYEYKFSDKKARILTAEEFNNLSEELRTNIYNISSLQLGASLLLDYNSEFIAQANVAGSSGIFPFSYNAGNSTSNISNFYIHPVIKVNKSDIIPMDISNCDEPVSFSTDSWHTIQCNIKKGNTDAYHVGDTKTIVMNNFGIHTVRIANKSTPSMCNSDSNSKTACGFVVEFADVITRHRMSPTKTDYQNPINGEGTIGGWKYSEIRAYLNGNVFGYNNYDYSNESIYNALPNDLKSVIIDTDVISGYGYYDSALFHTTDKLYLLSPTEVNGVGEYDNGNAITKPLDIYDNQNAPQTRVKKLGENYQYYWLRSPANDPSFRDCYYYVMDHVQEFNDYIDENTGTYEGGVSPAFRIG